VTADSTIFVAALMPPPTVKMECFIPTLLKPVKSFVNVRFSTMEAQFTKAHYTDIYLLRLVDSILSGAELVRARIDSDSVSGSGLSSENATLHEGDSDT
jgi:hypothetical protein